MIKENNDLSFIFAQVIKFGLPFGLIIAIPRLVYFYFITIKGVDSDVIVTSIGLIIFGAVWGLVLGFIRLRKKV